MPTQTFPPDRRDDFAVERQSIFWLPVGLDDMGAPIPLSGDVEGSYWPRVSGKDLAVDLFLTTVMTSALGAISLDVKKNAVSVLVGVVDVKLLAAGLNSISTIPGTSFEPGDILTWEFKTTDPDAAGDVVDIYFYGEIVG